MITITHTEYFGPISTYVHWYHSAAFMIEAYENYQKKSTRNKCSIAAPQGSLSLSVPLKKGKNNKASIQSVDIFHEESWQTHHLRSMRTSYNNTPFFEHYFDDIADLISSKHEHLWDLNMSIYVYFAEILHLSPVIVSEEFIHEYPAQIIDIRNYSKESIIYTNAHYRQPYDNNYEFLHNLSILDLLFCKGPESILYLKNETVANEQSNGSDF